MEKKEERAYIFKKSVIFLILFAIFFCVITLSFFFSFAALSDNGETNIYKVTFKIGNTIYKEEIVLENTLTRLPDLLGEDDNGVPFLCWYEDGGITPFNPRTLITKNTTLYAKFSNNFLVTFYDIDKNILEIHEVQYEQSTPVPTHDPKLDIAEELEYWMIEGTEYEYNLNSPVTSHLSLVPKIKKLSYAAFVTYGPEVLPQVNGDPFYAQIPLEIMERDGYSFSHWASDPSGQIPFDFENTLIDGKVLVYAVWTPEKVSYQINFYNEKANLLDPGDPSILANRANYEVVYSKVIPASSGLYAGTRPNITGLTANSEYTTGGVQVTDALDYSYFVYCDEPIISGTGTTVVNVFYNRTEFTFQFNLNQSYSTPNVGEYWIKLRGNDGKITGSHQFTAKLGQDISSLWPFAVGHDNPSYSSYKSTSWDSWYGNGTTELGTVYIKQAMMGGKSGRPTKTALTNIRMAFKDIRFSETRFYYTELLPGQYDESNPNHVAFTAFNGDGKNPYNKAESYYELNRVGVLTYQQGSPETGAKGWPGTTITGFRQINTSLTQYYQTVSLFPEYHEDTVTAYKIEYFMPRLSYSLTLVTPGAGFRVTPEGYTQTGETYTTEVLYKDTIRLPEIMPMKAGSQFVGWYTDEDYTSKFVEGTIITDSAVVLYAKFVGINTVNVNYYDGEEFIKNTQYELNDVILSHDLQGTDYTNYIIGEEVAGKGIFDGWYYTIGESIIPIQFQLEIHLISLEYNLYARWLPVSYLLTYRVFQENEYTFFEEQEILSGKNNTLAHQGFFLPIPEEKERFEFLGWNTEIDGKGTYLTAATPITGQTTLYAIYEEILGIDFVFYTVDRHGNKLSNISFQIYKENSFLTGNEAITVTSDEITGEVIVPYLTTGKYYLYEIVTLPGYQLPFGKWLIDINAEQEAVQITAIKDEESKTLPPAFYEEDNKYMLINYEEISLPLTGGNGVIFFTICGTILIMIAFMLIINNSKKEEKKKDIDISKILKEE